jgi:hypothetical protein
LKRRGTEAAEDFEIRPSNAGMVQLFFGDRAIVKTNFLCLLLSSVFQGFAVAFSWRSEILIAKITSTFQEMF